MSDDDELVSMTKAIMFGTHHQAVSDEQAQGIIALVLGGRTVANPAAYLRQALAQPDGARYGPPPVRPDAAPTGGSAGLDLITLRKAAMLRAESPEEVTAHAETAHRGADLARQMLADRARPEPVAAELPGELHGAALAASQAEQSRAARSADRLPVPDPEPDDDTDDGEDDHPDEGAQGAIDQARATREHMRRWAEGTDTHPGETDDEPDDEDDDSDDGEEPPY